MRFYSDSSGKVLNSKLMNNEFLISFEKLNGATKYSVFRRYKFPSERAKKSNFINNQ